MTEFVHISVMADEVLQHTGPHEGAMVVDCTLGGGGHTAGFLDAGARAVVGLDRDPAALAAATQRVADERLTPVHAAFDDVASHVEADSVDILFADLGVSSHQLDTAERGFSFQRGGPVDMRMDPTKGESAAELIARSTAEELADIIYKFGEEKRSRAVGRALVADRPFADTLELAEMLRRVVGGRGRIHPATRTFQALRIAVNDELGQLERLLRSSLSVVRSGGRIAFLTFHSLEDRMVKRFFALHAGKGLPKDPYGNPIGQVRLTNLRSIPPSPDDPNPRARSARLRVATRL